MSRIVAKLCTFTLSWMGWLPGGIASGPSPDILLSKVERGLIVEAAGSVQLSPPSVSFISPLDGAVVEGPDVILAVNAMDADGQVLEVEYFANGESLGVSAFAPFAFIWINAPLGDYLLTAEARDDSGLSSVSAPLRISVALPPPVLVSERSLWNYLDDGSDQNEAWRAVDFDDSEWKSGNARLGYGDTGLATIIESGPETNRYVTAYFRHAFDVEDPLSIKTLLLAILRDDGAIVYLNGVEVFRDNMPANEIDYLTFAETPVDGQAESAFFKTTVDPSLLQQGRNVVAVEVHQASVTSSDLRFDLGLYYNVPPATPRVQLAVTSVSDPLVAPATFEMTATASDRDGYIVWVEFFVDGVAVSEDADFPFEALVSGVGAGVHILTAVAHDNSGNQTRSDPVPLRVSPEAAVTTLIPAGSPWRFHDEGVEPSGPWKDPDYDDLSWSIGGGVLGYGLLGITGNNITPNTTVASRDFLDETIITHYFRRSFSVSNVGSFTNLLFRMLRDDGAVLYLNGNELFRMNMEAGPVDYATMASTPTGGTNELYYFPMQVDPAVMLEGKNVIAVELHQNSPTVTDAGFDLILEATSPPLVSPWISVTLVFGQVVIQWIGDGFNLQQADDPNGPWVDIEPVVNGGSYVTNPMSGQKFYRLRSAP